MVQRNWQAGWTGQHGRMRLPHQFFGLKSIALTTAATLALCGDRACKFLWPAVVEDLAGRFEPIADVAVRGDVAHVGGDFFLKAVRHRLDPEQPRHALDFEGRVALFTSGRDLGGRLHAVLVGHGDQLDAAGAPLRICLLQAEGEVRAPTSRPECALRRGRPGPR